MNFPDGTRIVFSETDDGSTKVGLYLGEREVSRTLIVPMMMRVGKAAVRMDGIGGVATEEDCRNRGYSRRVLEAAVRRMREGDAALSALYGIPNFYPKFGFASAGPEYEISLAPNEPQAIGKDLSEGWSARPFHPDDLRAIRRIYDLNTANEVGPLVRAYRKDDDAGVAELPKSYRAWDQLLKLAAEPSEPREDACRVLLDENEQVTAYVWLQKNNWWMRGNERSNPDTFHIGEVMALSTDAADAALTACCLWALESGDKFRRVKLVSPHNGLVASAARHRYSRFSAEYSPNADFMACTLDVPGLLNALEPELSERARSASIGAEESLGFRTDEGEATLAVTSEGVAVKDSAKMPDLVVELPQSTLARLCLGAYPPEDVLARLENTPNERTRKLVEILFPKRSPLIYPTDRF